MRCASVAEIRELDAAARGAAWCPPGVPRDRALMSVAARALSDEISILAARFPVAPEIIAVAGGGDNGGDAEMAADFLSAAGFRVTVLRMAEASSWLGRPPQALPRSAIVIDGILGIGLRGEPRPEAAAAIAWINAARCVAPSIASRIVVAVDVPSGIVADGRASWPVVRADFTVTMGLPKAAMADLAALENFGEIVVADIGYPHSAYAVSAESCDAASDACGASPSANCEIFAARDLYEAMPPRAWDSNKGDFGHVVVAASSERYSGAGALACLGALRGGAGLVSAFVPRSVVPLVAARAPELMVCGYDAPALCPAALRDLPFSLRGKVLAVGPGLSSAPGVEEAVAQLVLAPGLRAAVLDADALRPGLLETIARRNRGPLGGNVPLVLTPHPGEAARLLGVHVHDVQSDRFSAAREISERFGAVVLLKGAGSVVAAPRCAPILVAAGNPALAKGGSGDILCGICAALLARGVPPRVAAAGAAWLHGRAADLAVLRRGPESFAPTDLLSDLPC